MCIMEKTNCSFEEAQIVVNKQDKLKFTERTTRRPGVWERTKVTTFSREDQEARSIVSGGGGPGSGKGS